jgi:hypothetical protein
MKFWRWLKGVVLMQTTYVGSWRSWKDLEPLWWWGAPSNKKASYMRLMIFLDILTIVHTTIFSHNLLVLLPSKLVFLLLVKSLFLVTKSKKQNILVKLQNYTCTMMQIPYLHYILKFSSSLFSSLVPIFQISFSDLGTLWIIKNKGWNKDMEWDMVWDWGGLCGYLY